MKILFSDDIMPYGRYKGTQISDVLLKDPDYFKSPNHLMQKQFALSDEVIHKAYNNGTTKTHIQSTTNQQ
jgi:hypothetical protein